jgi:hypothetical protein
LYHVTKASTQVRAASRVAKGWRGKAGQYFGREHRSPFHRAAVLGMQHKAGGRDGVLATHGREQGGRVRVTLRRVHRPAHDAAAPDIHDEV